MKLNELTSLLDENGYHHEICDIEANEYYTAKGFRSSKRNKSTYIKVVTIKNPNHSQNLEFTLYNRDNDFVMSDLWFGGYSYELYNDDLYDVDLIIKEIERVMDNKVHIIFARNAKTDRWFCDMSFWESDEDWENNMDEYESTMKRIRKKKSLLWRIFGRTDKYEIYTWNDYECVIK